MITAEQKPTPLAAGLIYLGSNFVDKVPSIELKGTLLEGFSDNKALYKLFMQFLEEVRNGELVPRKIEYPPATTSS